MFFITQWVSFLLSLHQTPEHQAGYISEILTWAALNEGKNVLVDGSLRDHEWYKEYFQHLRHQYNDLHIAILHITASREAVLERAWVSYHCSSIMRMYTFFLMHLHP